MNESTFDIRWQQRFANYRRAFQQLREAVELAAERPLSRLEQQGLIKTFEFTQELSWNVMKDYFEYQGNTDITGSRDAIREAFRRGLVTDGDTWMDTIKSRNRSSHTYDENTANQLIETITTRYMIVFDAFQTRMQALADDAGG
ncbi:nucleotidyltransferase substrate binding protein [uncultured Thiodictyon sp.]|uniref:nucleotidyltransferase substrate binding protein n=3 Tax=uncultured Thiodictyon sp. TaxID=1846217 RepID=UPI0025F65964|nr:nucleotidyltransferase substrate binding protein [uncultured Thiodictyon sp.]